MQLRFQIIGLNRLQKTRQYPARIYLLNDEMYTVEGCTGYPAFFGVLTGDSLPLGYRELYTPQP